MSIALSKMNSNDPMFGDFLFELTNLMRAKGNVGIISDIISEATRFIENIIVKLTLTNHPL